MGSIQNMVKSILNGGGTGNSTSGGTQTKQMYRVRKTWADAASQKGAFTSLENAKNVLTKIRVIAYLIPTETRYIRHRQIPERHATMW